MTTTTHAWFLVRNMGQQNIEKEWKVYYRRRLNRERDGGGY